MSKPFSVATIQGDALWDKTAVAAYLGVDPQTIDAYSYRQYGSSGFPAPVSDPAVLITAPGPLQEAVRELLAKAGGQTAPMRLWSAISIMAWQTNRPRKGVGGRPKKAGDEP